MSWQIEKIGVRYAVSKLLPILWTAGDIAKRLQPAIVAAHRTGNNIPQKDGSRFTAALTDADVIIGTMIGAHILTMFEDATYVDEEKDQDRISAYFPPAARYQITLDPVDGTLYYLNDLPIFGVVLTILEDARIRAAVIYIPVPGMFYIGVDGDGAFTTTSKQVRNGISLWKPFRLRQDPPEVVLSFRDEERVRVALASAGFTVKSSAEYEEGKPWDFGVYSVLTGAACGIVQRDVPVGDWGAAGFIAGLAGGKTNDPVYDPATLRTPCMIVGANPQMYERIVNALDTVIV